MEERVYEIKAMAIRTKSQERHLPWSFTQVSDLSITAAVDGAWRLSPKHIGAANVLSIRLVASSRTGDQRLEHHPEER